MCATWRQPRCFIQILTGVITFLLFDLEIAIVVMSVKPKWEGGRAWRNSLGLKEQGSHFFLGLTARGVGDAG